jgi:archaellum component FlaF (FlaF/FlaG flagellin family)
MGLSVAIAGGIVMVTIMMVFLSIPNVVNTIFSIGEVTSKSSQVNDLVSKTKISVQEMYTQTGSPRVNFTLNNEGSTTLWDFDNFNVLIEYTGAISGKKTEQLSYNGECLGAVPPAGQWCIQSILNDVADPKLLNSDERASIWTNLNENLVSAIAIVTVATDNGVTFKTGGSDCGSDLPLPSCKKHGYFYPISTTLQCDGLLCGGAATLVGTEIFGSDADGLRMESQTAFGVGSDAGFISLATSTFSYQWDAYLDARIQVLNTTNNRYQIGFTDDTSLDNNNTPCNNDECATIVVRSTDATYQYIVNDGDAAQDVTDSGITESTGVVRMQVWFESANSMACFQIDSNPITCLTNELPASNTALRPVVIIENSVANQRQSIEWYYIYATQTK